MVMGDMMADKRTIKDVFAAVEQILAEKPDFTEADINAFVNAEKGNILLGVTALAMPILAMHNFLTGPGSKLPAELVHDLTVTLLQALLDQLFES